MTNLYKPFEDKFKQFGFEYNRAEDLYDAMRTIHRLVGSRDYGNIKTMDQDVLGSALIDILQHLESLRVAELLTHSQKTENDIALNNCQ